MTRPSRPARRTWHPALAATLVAALLGAASTAQGQHDRTSDILALRHLLVGHEWAALDSALAVRAAAARRDVTREGGYVFAYDAFSSGDSLLQRHFDAWIAAEPRAARPRVARATYFRAMANAATRHGRTDKYTDEASHEFRGWRTLARADARAGRRLDSTEVMAYAADMGSCEGEPRDLAAVTREWPSTLLLRARYMAALSSGCGGSRDSLLHFAREQQRAAPTANLRALSALAIFHVAYERDQVSAVGDSATIAALSSAIARGDFWQIRFARALEYLRVSAYDAALADLDRVLEQRPAYAAALAWRAWTLRQIGRDLPFSETLTLRVRAWADILSARALNEHDPQVAFVLGEEIDDDSMGEYLP